MIDYLSDTVTQPTDIMRRAMFEAEVGDDCYGEDPTVVELENLACQLMGKEAAALVTSGTLANLSALLSHCPRGYEVILGDQSDLYHYEAGGVSIVGGAVLHPVVTEKNGSLLLNNIRLALRDISDYQCAPPGVIVLENPHCLSGGRVLSLDYLKSVRELADEHSLPIHMDGARIFNAAARLGVPVVDIVQYVDSVQFCLSKSLAAPFGSMVCGSVAFIDRVKRYKKMLGGGLRQAGIMASAGIVALTSMVERLPEDHRRAALLAEKIRDIEGVNLDPAIIETNMVFFSLEDSPMSLKDFLEVLKSRGVRMGILGSGKIRAVIHYMITDADIEKTAEIIKQVLKQAIKKIRYE